MRMLRPDGSLVLDERYPADVDPETLRGHYRDMTLVRRLDREATALQRQGELGLWVPSLGQEATQIGAARALRSSDFVFPTYRDHGVPWVRGVAPLDLLRMVRGVTHGGWDPIAHGCGLYSIVVGAQGLHGVGYAMGMEMDGAEGAVLTFFGDGATDQGDISEALVFAARFEAPVVLLCENNQWAISTPRVRPGADALVRRAAGFGIPAIRVDGNDVVAVHAVTASALASARSGNGPVFVEAVTFRLGAHTTSDDPSRYRDEAEVEAWSRQDPIERVRAHLLATTGADPSFFDDVEAESQALAEALRHEVRSMPNPAPESMFDYVYAEPHEPLARQREAFVAYESSFLSEDEARA